MQDCCQPMQIVYHNITTYASLPPTYAKIAIFKQKTSLLQEKPLWLVDYSRDSINSPRIRNSNKLRPIFLLCGTPN